MIGTMLAATQLAGSVGGAAGGLKGMFGGSGFESSSATATTNSNFAPIYYNDPKNDSKMETMIIVGIVLAVIFMMFRKG